MLVGYARISTKDQQIALQIDALVAEGVDERNLYKEVLSGALRNRPELEKMLKYVKKGDTVIVWKLDRLGRSLADLIEIVEGLKKRGIGFRSLTEKLDTQSPTGRLFFHLFGALAEYERSLIKERILAGIEIARREGRMLGRPRVLDLEKIEIVKKLALEGRPKKSIADILGVSISVIYRALN